MFEAHRAFDRRVRPAHRARRAVGADVEAALREVRVALLEADVALPVVKDFIAKVRTEAVGEAVIKSVKPGQQIIKIVHDALIEMLGGDGALKRCASLASRRTSS